VPSAPATAARRLPPSTSTAPTHSAADAGVSAIVRDAEVNGHCLVYHADRDQPAEKAAAHDALKSLGIIVR